MQLPMHHLLDGRIQAPTMRSLNGIRLLNLVRQHGAVSRANLAKLSGMSKPAVSDQIARLLDRGLLVELGRAPAGPSGGKKATLLEFNRDAGRVVAAEIGTSQTSLLIADLEGKSIAREQFQTALDRGVDAVLSDLCAALRPHMGADSTLRSIAVAVPGRVDQKLKRVLEADNLLHWRDVSIGAALEQEFHVPVVVDNDVKLAALGELHHGLARGVDNALLIRLTTGIGAGMIVNGSLYHGSHWAAGEMSHMVLDRAGLEKPLSPRGMLEDAVGLDRVLERLRSVEGEGVDLSKIDETSQAGVEVLDDVAELLGIAAGNLAAVFDPAIVILSGSLMTKLAARVESTVHRIVPWPMQVGVSTLGDDAALCGALNAGLESAYEQISRSLEQEEIKTAAVTR